MSANGYRLLGYAVWRGGKWYLRQRLPSGRTMAAAALATVSVGMAAVVIARRVAG